MSETIRFGDVTGYDDAEVIEIGDDAYIVTDKEDKNDEDIRSSI